MYESNIFPNISEENLIIPSADKRKRAQAIRAVARAGKVEIDDEAEWYEDFITEMVQFDRGTYKDQVDAISLVGLGLNRMIDAPTQEELDDWEWEEEFNNELYSFEEGRSTITGY
jgi:phage terminase large subunit-like protein